MLVSTSSLCRRKTGARRRVKKDTRGEQNEMEKERVEGENRSVHREAEGEKQTEQQHTNQCSSISLNAWQWIKQQSKDVIQLAFQKFI